MEDKNISSINYNGLTEEIFKVEEQWINFTKLKNLECNTSLNSTQCGIQNSTELPPSLKFDDNAKNDIVMYSVLFFIAAVGNLTVFITLFRSRYWKSRVNLMIMHLAAADLMVTFLLIPLEIGWRITTQWLAGNSACKVFQFLRAFCLYLSSMVLVCISLDRYFAILFPLKVNDAQRRGKLMLGFAWTTAAACSLPQSIIFHVDSHPEYPSFKQCVTFGFFMTQSDEKVYNLFCLSVMYFLPLVLIVAVYVRILFEISQKSKESKDFFKSIEEQRKLDTSSTKPNSRLRLRRSDMTSIERARTKSLKMTVIIVLAFIWCWTPYVVMVLWYMFDRASAEKVDRRLQDVLFIMAVSNSCVNPLVYGTYNLNLKNELWRCLGRQTDQPLSRRPTASTSFRGRGSIAYQPSVSSYHSPNAKTFDEIDYSSRPGENNFTRRKQTSFYKGLLQDQKETSPFHFRHGNSFMSKKTSEVGNPENTFGHTSVEVQFIELPIIEINSKPHKSTAKNENLLPKEINHSLEYLNIPIRHTIVCDDDPNLILESDLNNFNAGFLADLGPKSIANQ